MGYCIPDLSEKNLSSIRFSSAGLFTATPANPPSERIDQPAEIIAVISGLYQATVGKGSRRRTFTAGPGEVVFWPEHAHRLESTIPSAPCRCYYAYFHWPHPNPELPTLVYDYNRVIRQLVSQLVTVRRTPFFWVPYTYFHLWCQAVMMEFSRLATIIRDPLLVAVIRYTEDHLGDAFDLSDLARQVRLEPHHFTRKFKQHCGITPMAYVRRRRGEHAVMHLWNNPEISLEMIGQRVGIRDLRSLRRLIREVSSLPIGAIRQHKTLPGHDIPWYLPFQPNEMTHPGGHALKRNVGRGWAKKRA
jgi:AraC-like DNA-binding protein